MTSVSNKNIIIVGGGPVGMYVAILLSRFVKKIVIIEKRTLPFTRNQIIVFDINKINPSIRKELLDKLKLHGICFVAPPATTLGITCYSVNKPLISCPLNILETVLNDMVKKYSNIIILRGSKLISIDSIVNNITVQDINGNENIMNFNILIGADGKNSIVKNTFKEQFKETFIISSNDRVYGAIIVFKVDPKTVKLRQREVLLNFLHKRARVFQHKSGIIYVGLAISEIEYNLEDNTPLLNVAYQYLKINDISVSEKNLQYINKFENKISYCNVCNYKNKDSLYILIGDACFNTHFFTGSAFNAHFDASGELVRMLKTNLNDYNKHHFYRNFIAFNKSQTLKYILKFRNYTNEKDVLVKVKKSKIPAKVIKSLSPKELFYLIY